MNNLKWFERAGVNVVCSYAYEFGHKWDNAHQICIKYCQNLGKVTKLKFFKLLDWIQRCDCIDQYSNTIYMLSSLTYHYIELCYSLINAVTWLNLIEEPMCNT